MFDSTKPILPTQPCIWCNATVLHPSFYKSQALLRSGWIELKDTFFVYHTGSIEEFYSLETMADSLSE